MHSGRELSMFRTMFILVSVVLLSPPAQGGEGAGLDAMRSTLEKAGTLRMTFQSEVETDKGKDSVKGVMTIGEGNRARIEIKMSLGGKTVNLTLISDGKTTQHIVDGKRPLESPTDPKLRKNVIAMIESGGVAIPLFVLRPFATIRTKKGGDGPDLEKSLKVSNIKQKETEKGVFAHDLHVDGKARFRVELTIDAANNLPVRRVLEVVKGADRATVRETYTVEVEPMLTGDVFELRKAE